MSGSLQIIGDGGVESHTRGPGMTWSQQQQESWSKALQPTSLEALKDEGQKNDIYKPVGCPLCKRALASQDGQLLSATPQGGLPALLATPAAMAHTATGLKARQLWHANFHDITRSMGLKQIKWGNS